LESPGRTDICLRVVTLLAIFVPIAVRGYGNISR
jgi:hypothetical protein